MVIVDFAIEDDDDGSVLVLHRLRGRLRQIDDLEPAMQERHLRIDEPTLRIGPPMAERGRHAFELLRAQWTAHGAEEAAHSVEILGNVAAALLLEYVAILFGDGADRFRGY